MDSANGGQHYTDQMFRMAETFLREESNLSVASGGGVRKASVWVKMKPYVLFRGVVSVVVAALAGAGIGTDMEQQEENEEQQ